MSQGEWEFWIDVGGTFTDCLARRPDGTLRRHKLLSSGVTKGQAGPGSDRRSIVDPARRGDPNDFWRGWSVRLVDRDVAAGQSRVAQFDCGAGILRLEPPLPAAPRPAQAYELTSDQPAPVVGIRYLLELAPERPTPPVSVRLGTTRGTNALLTRGGARAALVTTAGFGDLLEIGYQQRPRLFELAIRKSPPPLAAVCEINERLAADGAVLRAPDPAVVRRQLAALREQGIESLAVCLLHACANPAHEQQIGALARELNFDEVSLSHQVAPLVKIVPRGDTTLLDAYLNPVLRRYVSGIERQLPGSRLRLLTSAGGLVAAEHFSGKDSLLSGPAGGVVGFSRVAQAAGLERAIGLDMGGTSTDVARFDGRYEFEYETETAGVRIVAPQLAIETVAAGGGSICRFDGVKLVVGPDSAGADPGPTCYGRGGPLTITDCNVFLGRVQEDYFPFPLERAAIAERLAALADELDAAGAGRWTPQRVAAGLLRVANAHMAGAIRSVSVAKGCDPREYVLVAFGGAAGQHACAVADELGIGRVLCHPDAGLLSAWGAGLADVERRGAAAIDAPGTPDSLRALEPLFDRLTRDADEQLEREGIPAARRAVRRGVDVRYQGVDAALTLWDVAPDRCPAEFAAAHLARYGYLHEGRELELVAARVEASGRSGHVLPRSVVCPPPSTAWRQRGAATMRAWYDGSDWRQAPVLRHEQLLPGDRLAGPALVCLESSTVVIEPGWEAGVLSQGELLLERAGRGEAPTVAVAASTAADPVLLEIFNQQLAGIAERMGHTLRATSSSVNVKERLDFSCALLTADGELAASAAHIPVHLGAMAETVRTLLRERPELAPGDVLVTNDPYRGGSHLPDVTVVTPVFDRGGQRLFVVANRAHHAEIGGSAPGSMPPFSRCLAEEGVLIRDFKLLDAGRPRFAELRELLCSGPYPSRDPQTNLADLAAQVAANRTGELGLLELVERWTLPVVDAYLHHIQTAAETKVRRALAKLPPGQHRCLDHLDDGTPIAVTVRLEGERAVLDFTGSGPVSAGNLNANCAIVTAAVTYVLRALIDEEIPLNQGLLAPVDIVLPPGLLNPPPAARPEESPAVAGGNVETSQRIVDVLLGALGLAAASQGTMNNLLCGDRSFGYYETICGGAGATATADGADAVHTHMTNTRLTDPEVLERRYPLRVRRFAIRRGSGGRGAHRGGDGVVRELEFLAPLAVSLLAQRRGPYPPFGLAGGEPGALGEGLLTRRDGAVERLSGMAHFEVQPGDVLTLLTPGGGGWGRPSAP